MSPKASDITDEEVLSAVKRLTRTPPSIYRRVHVHWTTTLAVCGEFPDMPPKVVAAKLRRVLGRGLVDGCSCGCRGDWYLTAKGREVLAQAVTPGSRGCP